MKNQISLFLALLCFVMLTSCGGGGTSQPVSADLSGYTIVDLDGTNAATAQKNNPNGGLLENGYVMGGSKHGQWTTYDGDGNISTVANYIAGMKNGVELTFNKRGMIEGRTSYLNNQLDGLSGTYKNGRPLQETMYKNGQFHGITKKYFKNGKLQQEIGFKNGKQDGMLRYYDEEGNVTLEYVYKNGEKVSGGIVEK